MELAEKIRKMFSSKNTSVLVVIMGSVGLLLILISSVIPDKKSDSSMKQKTDGTYSSCENYCSETEKRLEKFLMNIEGAGDVKVYLSVGSGEKYVYAAEGKTSISDNNKEEERKYVTVGGNGEKTALIETVETPEITGIVVACTGCSSPVVQERIYNSVSAALGIPTGKIYVTIMKQGR